MTAFPKYFATPFTFLSLKLFSTYLRLATLNTHFHLSSNAKLETSDPPRKVIQKPNSTFTPRTKPRWDVGATVSSHHKPKSLEQRNLARFMILAKEMSCIGLFEGDQDLDLVSDISYDVFKDNQPDPTKSTKADQPDSEEDEEDFDPSKDLLLGDVAAIRAKLDGNGTGDALLAEYRAKEGEFQGQYRILLLGALMMRAGARIRADDLQHLRELVPQVTCNEGSTFVLWDDGFRGPGKRQFLAALDAYKEGVPRDFRAARCVVSSRGLWRGFLLLTVHALVAASTVARSRTTPARNLCAVPSARQRPTVAR